MLGFAQYAVLRVQPPHFHDLFGKLALLLNGPILIQKVGADGAAALFYGSQQRHNGLAQGGKESIALGNGQAVFIAVQPDFIRVAVRGKIVGLRAQGFHNFFQIRGKTGKVIAALCLAPCGHAFLRQLGERGVLFCRDLANLVIAALQLPHFCLFLFGFGISGSALQQGGGVSADQLVKVGAAQHLHGFGAARAAFRRSYRLTVIIGNGHCVLVGIQSFLQLAQSFDGIFH